MLEHEVTEYPHGGVYGETEQHSQSEGDGEALHISFF